MTGVVLELTKHPCVIRPSLLRITGSREGRVLASARVLRRLYPAIAGAPFSAQRLHGDPMYICGQQSVQPFFTLARLLQAPRVSDRNSERRHHENPLRASVRA